MTTDEMLVELIPKGIAVDSPETHPHVIRASLAVEIADRLATQYERLITVTREMDDWKEACRQANHRTEEALHKLKLIEIQRDQYAAALEQAHSHIKTHQDREVIDTGLPCVGCSMLLGGLR